MKVSPSPTSPSSVWIRTQRMLGNSPRRMVSREVIFMGRNVHGEKKPSSPRRRGSSASLRPGRRRKLWIPAFAGMTVATGSAAAGLLQVVQHHLDGFGADGRHVLVVDRLDL